MKKLLAIVAVLICLCLGTALSDGPSLKVCLDLKGETLVRTSDIKRLVLVNAGEKKIEVPTANMVATVRETGDSATLTLSFWRPAMYK